MAWALLGKVRGRTLGEYIIRRSAVASGAGDAMRKNAGRVLVMEAQICGHARRTGFDVVAILH